MKKVLVILLSGLIVACGGSDKKSQGGKTVFKYNQSAGITSLDPAFAKDQAIMWATNELFNGLVQLDDKLKIIPCIASSWEISENGLQYTFHLRDDVFFHDSEVFEGGKGRKVAASDFVFSFNRILDKTTNSPGLTWALHSLNPIDHDSLPGSVAVDDSTLQINIRKPFTPFLGVLTMPYFYVIPSEAIDKYGKDFNRNPVGTGPFRFSVWDEGVKMVFLKNENYFEKDEEGNQLPYLDGVAITFVTDKQITFLEFKKGNLDFISGIDASYKDELLTKEGKLQDFFKGKIKMLTQPYMNTEYLGFLMDETNPLYTQSPTRFKKVRQAISYGFNRKKLIRYLRNNIGTPGNSGFIPKGFPSYDPEIVKGYEYNIEKAQQLLAEAGFPGGKGLPEIVLGTNHSYLDICEGMQSQLAEIGISIKLEVNQAAIHRELVAQSKLGWFRGSWIADYADAENYLALYYSKNFSPSGPNYTHFSNAVYDALYEEAQLETEDEKRYALYQKMDNIIMEEAAVVILYYDQVVRLIGGNIKGLGNNAMNMLKLKRVRKQ